MLWSLGEQFPDVASRVPFAVKEEASGFCKTKWLRVCWVGLSSMALASQRAVLSKTAWTRLAAFTKQPLLPNATVFCACPESTYSALPDDYNCKVELALTSDRKTIVCYHPSLDIPYEHTRPIPHLDPLDYREETHDQMLKSRLDGKNLKKQGPMIEELSKMFYTTKHRWYPVGQYHTRRKKTNTPKDR